ncbi:MAG: MFS transporter [Candidatus Bathyarchaeota archaeon]|nr:MAG: MFS transporter [Candidatus Bathyarchaeota archaeon]
MKNSGAYLRLLLFGFLQLFGYSMSSPFLPILGAEQDPTKILAGVLIGSHFLSRVFTELPSGLIIDRLGGKKPILLSFLLSAIGAIVCAFSMSIYMLLLGLMIWGLGSAFFFTSSTILVIRFFELHSRGRALGTLQAVGFAGIFVGAPVGGFIAEYLGYKLVFLVSGAFMVAGFLIAFFSKSFKERLAKRPGRVSTLNALRELKNWRILCICIASLFRMYIAQGIMLTSFPIYLHDFLNVGIGLIGISMGIRTLGLSIGTIAFGYVADRRGRKSVALAGLAIESICLCLFTRAFSFMSLLSLVFLEGMGSGMLSVALILFVTEQTTKYQGSIVGLYRTFMDIGAVTGPIFTMVIYTIFGVLATFTFGAVMLILNILTLSTVKSRK